MVFDVVSRSRKWDSRDFLIFFVMVGWKGKNFVKDGVVDFSCLLNCLRLVC